MKAGYGEPLRKFFAENAWVESMVDFGHAKQIFEDADVFPSILVARKPAGTVVPATARVCAIPREQLRIDDLSEQIRSEGFEIPRERLTAEPWALEPLGSAELMKKIQAVGIPLREFSGMSALYGIKTACNEAFLINTATRNKIVADGPKSAEVIKPYIRGQDIDRWVPRWADMWMIVMKSSGDFPWPWAESGAQAETVFHSTYPSLHAHLSAFRDALMKRQDQGRFWWELRPCAFWDEFSKPKIWFQQIQFHPRYAIERHDLFGNNKTTFLPTDDLYLLCVLNSPLIWWHNFRFLPHMKDEALATVVYKMDEIPIAKPKDNIRSDAETKAKRIVEIIERQQVSRREVLDWLRVEFAIAKRTQKLADPLVLDADSFVAEVKKIRGRNRPLTVAGLRSLREEHARTIEPLRPLGAEAMALERQISELVNAAYGLTPEEVALIWKTAPPRMPIGNV